MPVFLMKLLFTTCLLHSAILGQCQSVWDYAPDFGNDPFPPYPPLTDDDGSNISIDNLRGTHIYGFKGCTEERRRLIQEAYSDFHTLADQLDVYNNIVWTDRAVQDFFGNNIPDGTRKEIIRMLYNMSFIPFLC